MFVSHKFKCVYMPPPKTGTTSVVRAMELLGGEPFVWGDGTPPFLNFPDKKHLCHLPKELKRYFVFASVRNPYTRQISRFVEQWKKDVMPTQRDFEAYTYGPKTSDKFSCSGWLNLKGNYRPPAGHIHYKIQHLIRLESIVEDFNKLPFVTKEIEFPHWNKGVELPLKFDLSMSCHLFNVMEVDFHNFGYHPMFKY